MDCPPRQRHRTPRRIGALQMQRMFPAGTHAGVIRLRVWPTTVEAAEAGLDRLLNTTEDSTLIGSLVIIDRARVRVRRSARHD